MGIGKNNMKNHLSLFLAVFFVLAFQEAASKCTSRNGNSPISTEDSDEGQIFTALIAAKLLSRGQEFLPVAPQAEASLTTPALSLTPSSAEPVVSSVFNAGATVPQGSIAIGGRGPTLSSDDPEFGEDGTFLSNKLLGRNDIDLEEILINNRQNINASPEELKKQNEALKRKLKQESRRWQAQQRRNAIRRRNRSAARRRAQRARARSVRRRQLYRKNRVRQEAVNSQRRRNLRRSPARRKILRRVIV